MRSSHSKQGVDPDVAAVGPNKADISGMAGGPSSDEINDRTGRPREGQVSPPGPRPHFVNVFAYLGDASGVEQAMAGAVWNPSHPNYVPGSAFERASANNREVIWGWIADLRGDWYPVADIRRISVNGGRVEARVPENSQAIVLANYGAGDEAFRNALSYRARAAWYIAECRRASPDRLSEPRSGREGEEFG